MGEVGAQSASGYCRSEQNPLGYPLPRPCRILNSMGVERDLEGMKVGVEAGLLRSGDKGERCVYVCVGGDEQGCLLEEVCPFIGQSA